MAIRGELDMRRPLDDVRVVMIRQCWQQPAVRDIPTAVGAALEKAGALARIRTGDEIAITAGSRGIASMPQVLRAIIEAVRERGGRPFIFPAMGSHGGGTAEGQRELLAGLGVDERTMGVPIRATMDVVQLGTVDAGIPVYLDAIAARADGIIVVNRIKKHTNFDGIVESGLCKMAVIGMGKHTQAAAIHQYGNQALADYIRPIAEVIYSKAKILGGIAILENAWGGVGDLVGLAPDWVVAEEPALLRRAKEWSAKIPFHQMDIALVERMGKEISGTGMDCYVIGRRRIIGEAEWPEAPQISSLIVLGLTEASHGNGLGVGLADLSTRALAEKIDWSTTYKNVLTSGNIERAKLPLLFDSDQAALEAAAFRERAKPLSELRLVCMRDTLHLRHLLVSESMLDEVRARGDLEVIGAPMALPFDGDGNWVSPLPEVE